jgi:type IV secretion system protein VirB8
MTSAIAIDPPLPLSSKALRKIAESDSWDTDRQTEAAASRRRAWLVAGAAVVLALLGFAMAVFQSMRPGPPPAVVVVDRTTGETMVVPQFDENSVPQLSPLDQHWAAVFVRARESYYFNLLRNDYDQVARMTTPETWAPYGAKFTGENALQTKVGAAQEHRVTIVSVRMSTTTRPGRRGEAIVTYDKEVHNNQGISLPVMRYVATVGFEYRPRSMKSAVDRTENPLGFVVLSYRSDAELVSPSSATAATPAAAGGSQAAQRTAP